MQTLAMTRFNLRDLQSSARASPGRRAAAPRAFKIWITLAMILIVFVTLLILFPANWLAYWVAQKSEGRIILADAQGSLWQGSAVLGFAEAAVNRPVAERGLALPGRIEWKIKPGIKGALILLRHEGVLSQPLQLQATPSRLTIPAGAASLPLALSQIAGAPMNTLRLQGTARMQWNAFTLPLSRADSGDVSAAAGTIELADVRSSMSSALASVDPLGSYRIHWQTDSTGRLQWQVMSAAGPLLFEGQGSSMRGFSGRAMIAPGTPVMTAQRLLPLLNVLGRRVNGNATNESAVTIQIGGN